MTDEPLNAKADADRYNALPPDDRDRIAHAWSDRIYFCPECDDACRESEDYHACPRCPGEHDADTAYMGTGTDSPEDVRRLARLIATDGQEDD